MVILASGAFSWRRWRELQAEIARRQESEAEQARLQLRLEAALTRLRSLQGIMGMCSWCKSIRDPTGDWHPLELYLENHFEAHLTHGVCPECMRVQYPTLFDHGDAGGPPPP